MKIVRAILRLDRTIDANTTPSPEDIQVLKVSDKPLYQLDVFKLLMELRNKDRPQTTKIKIPTLAEARTLRPRLSERIPERYSTIWILNGRDYVGYDYEHNRIVSSTKKLQTHIGLICLLVTQT